MRELMPDSWQTEEGPSSCCHSSRPKRSGLITDIARWTECYASLVAVLSTAHPDKTPHKTPHFMAYLKTIVHASRNFEGSVWASYDMAFHRQAASSGSYDWATIDTALYNEAFTGRTKAVPRCRYCLSDYHNAADCHFGPAQPLEDTIVPKFKTPGPSRRDTRDAVELCGLFNHQEGNRCRYSHCRYAHICAKCHTGPHPAAECGRRGNKACTPTSFSLSPCKARDTVNTPSIIV